MNQTKPSANPSAVNIAAVAPAAKPPEGAPAAGASQAAPAVKALTLDAFWATDVGRARDHNEDAIGGPLPDAPTAARGHLFIVADGMGGHNAGEVASNEAAKRVYQRYYSDGEANVFRSLERIMGRVNDELYQQAQANPAQRGMGTTMTAFVIKDNHLTAAHVGDSRLYLIRGGKIEQVTHDHSWVEEQVRAGELTRLQAESHPQRNVITRALATAPDVRVDPFELDLQAGDILVFCSDGLNTEVGDPQIAALATKATSAEVAARRLIELANDNGGEDNISVGVIRVLEAAAAPVAAATAVPVAAAAAAPRKTPLVPIIGGIAALVIVIGGFVIFGHSLVPPPTTSAVTLPTNTSAPVVPTVTQNPAVAGQPTAPGSRPATTEPITRTVAVTTTASVVSATSTLMPTVAPAPSATPKPAAGGAKTPTPTSKAAPANPTIAAAPILLGPPDKETVTDRTTFRWQAVELPPGAAYEVVWWQKDAHPDTAVGFASPTMETFREVDIAAYAAQKALPANQAVRWTVIVVTEEPSYKRITFPSARSYRELTYVPSSTGGSGGGCTDPGCGK